MEEKAYIMMLDIFFIVAVTGGLFFIKPMFNLLFLIADLINVYFIQKLVQMFPKRDIIVMSQGGKGRHGKRFNQQRSPGNKRSFGR